MKKIKKLYETGGQTAIPYTQIGQFAGDIIDVATPTNEYGVKSNGAAMGSGALKGAGQGAAMGASVAGPWGAVIGGAIGGVGGAITGKKQNDKAIELQEQATELKNRNLQLMSQNRLMNYDITGSNSNQIYAKYGGQLPIKYLNGGELTPISSESVEVQGNSHSKGGVQLTPQIEVEGKETIKGGYVYSDSLGFAEKHKSIAKSIGKLEKKPVNNITNNTIKLLKDKEEALKMKQELVRSMNLKPIK